MRRPSSTVLVTLSLLAAPVGCGDPDLARDALIGATDTGTSGTDTVATEVSEPSDTTAPDATAAPDTTDTTTPDTTATMTTDTTVTSDTTATADTAEPSDTSEPVGCPPLACDTPLPPLGPEADWRHTVATPVTTLQGDARHRGRDLYLRASDPQWALAKFAYGPFDDDLKDEDVDIWLLRGCGATWELLATVTTSSDGDHAEVEGLPDTGGRVYYELPPAQRLGLGRHRLAFVVRGDHSIAHQFIEVLPDDARIVVTDVDGTQTSSEIAEFGNVFLGIDPDAQPYGADVLWAFARRGYHIFYLTARPDWLHTRTHEWLGAHGYPPGIVHTTLSFTGVNGDAAVDYKVGELSVVLGRFPGAIVYAIGNTDSDATSFATVGIAPANTFLYQFDPGARGTRVDDYQTLLPVAAAAPSLCE